MKLDSLNHGFHFAVAEIYFELSKKTNANVKYPSLARHHLDKALKLNSNDDFLTPWLKFILNFFGIEKVEVVSADQMSLDYEKSIKEAEKQIENLS